MAQFPLFASVFCQEALSNDIDLAILFTNHVASAMHRYLHAVPGLEGDNSPYDDAWRQKYQGEVFFALDLLDSWIAKIARKSGLETAIVITSAIGQKLNSGLTREIVQSYTTDYRLEDLDKFLTILEIAPNEMELVGAMLPQYSFKCKSENAAKRAKAQLMRFCGKRIDRFGHYTRPIPDASFQDTLPVSGIYLNADQNGNIFTLTVMLQPDSGGEICIGEISYKPSELGFSITLVSIRVMELLSMTTFLKATCHLSIQKAL